MSSAGGPTLELLDRVVLDESDSLYIGRLGGLFVATDGEMYVPDVFADHIIRYGPDGTAIATYGAAGAGPGEFRTLSSAVFATEGLVAGIDHATRSLEVFSRATREYVGSVAVNGLTTRAAVSNGSVFLGTIDPAEQRAVTILNVQSDGEHRDDRGVPVIVARGLVPLPIAYRDNPTIRGTYGIVNVAPGNGNIAVGFAADPYLRLVEPDGGTRDSIYIPVSRRRGVPDDLSRRASYETASLGEIIEMTSALLGIGYGDNGYIVTVHADETLMSRTARAATAKLYVSLVSPDRGRACVDTLVPTDTIALPQVDLRGDTLWVIEQHLSEVGTGQGMTTVSKYRVTDQGCTWLETER